ncbi:MAG: hypothetical protein AAF614_23605 [Chloroflexota bacterium]
MTEAPQLGQLAPTAGGGAAGMGGGGAGVGGGGAGIALDNAVPQLSQNAAPATVGVAQVGQVGFI